MDVALDMARVAVANGTTTIACTPHILPGVYHNTGPQIVAAVAVLQKELHRSQIPLRLVSGADVHLVPDLVAGLRNRMLPTLNASRYFLLEPPHHVAPPRLEHLTFSVLTSGFVPILTHPERLSWIEKNYDLLRSLSRAGVWMQLTAGSITGRFGRRPRYWAERMLSEGMVHLIATDAHDLRARPPVLSEARDIVARLLGEQEAIHQVQTRPEGVLNDVHPSTLPMPRGALHEPERPRGGLLRRAFGNAFSVERTLG